MSAELMVDLGTSAHEDAFRAGVEAARQVVVSGAPGPDALIVFGSCRFDHQQLLAGIASVFGDLPLVGGTTAGEICGGGIAEGSVVVMALRSSVLRFFSGIGTHMSDDETACAMALVNDLRGRTSFDDALSFLVFPNGMGGDGIKVVDGLHRALGESAEVVGGYLGDDDRFKTTYQYYDGKVYRDAMVGLVLCGDGRFVTGIGVSSGFESIGNRFYCTEAKNNTVLKFDDESALALYKEFIGEERAARLPGICLEYPFGLIDDKVSIGNREYFQLRCGLQVNHAEGSISLAGSIPEGSAVTLTTASRGDIINGARLAARQAKECLGKAEAKAVLMFSCVGRKLVLGRRTAEEVYAVQKELGPEVPIIGLYTYGEIGPVDKRQEQLAVTRFHNETVVLWVLGRA